MKTRIVSYTAMKTKQGAYSWSATVDGLLAGKGEASTKKEAIVAIWATVSIAHEILEALDKLPVRQRKFALMMGLPKLIAKLKEE